MPVEDADYEHDKKWFEHLKENLNEVLPEMLDEKQDVYKRQWQHRGMQLIFVYPL